MNTQLFNPLKKTKSKPYELSGIVFTIFFFWLLGDDKLLYFKSICLADLYNLLFTIVIVFATWLLFKWVVWLLQSIKNNYSLTSYYILQTSVTGSAMLLFIFISNWIYIYLIWQKSFEDNYFLTVIFPTAAIFSVIWNLIELCFYLYTKANSIIPVTIPPDLNELDSSNSEITSVSDKENNLWVRAENKYIKLNIDEVAFIILQDSIVWIALFDGNKYIIDKTLNELETVLSENFFRATRQLILSRKAIQRIEDDTNQKIRVYFLNLNGFPESCIVSRYKASAFKKFSLAAVQ